MRRDMINDKRQSSRTLARRQNSSDPTSVPTSGKWVQRLNQALRFYQSLCFIDSELLPTLRLRQVRNRHLRVADNPYASCRKTVQLKT